METIKKYWTAATWDKRSMRDLQGWTVVVIGATDGVGYESAKAFAEHNAHTIVVGRNKEKTAKCIEEFKKTAGPNAKVEPMYCDVSSFESVRQFTEEYKKKGYPLHVLLNNAAIQSPKGKRGAKTEEGFEITLGVNHFGLVYLTLHLLDVIKKTAKEPNCPTSRIVWVTSLGSQLVNPPVIGNTTQTPGIDYIGWEDLNLGSGNRLCRGETRDESDWWQYARSKIFNIMTCKELARRLEGTGVTNLVAHPGLAVTDHFGKSDSENKLSSKLIETYANSPIGQSAEGGAIPLEFACTAAELEGHNGGYIGSPELGLLNVLQAREQVPNAPLCSDPVALDRLWNETVKIIDDASGENWTKEGPQAPAATPDTKVMAGAYTKQ